MKRIILLFLTGCGIVCFPQRACSKDFKERIIKEFTLSPDASGTTLHIYNICGSIKVEAYSGKSVILEAEKMISAGSDKNLETGKNEFRLGFGQTNDSIIAYIAEPLDSRPHKNYVNNYLPEYKFKVDFIVRVPSGVNLQISTVTDGNIEVNNVAGKLHINNVNGGISITNAASKTYAHTVNGNVFVTYVTNPAEASSYHTINGDISISYRPGLSADITFKSMNGELFTDFRDAVLLTASPAKLQDKQANGTVYKLNQTTSVRFGKGGKTFSFETLNGYVYIKKQS